MVARKMMKITSDLRAIYERFTSDLTSEYEFKMIDNDIWKKNKRTPR